MYIYKYEVKYTDCECNNATEWGFLVASSWSEAAQKLDNFYRNDLVEFSLAQFGEGEIINFLDQDKEAVMNAFDRIDRW